MSVIDLGSIILANGESRDEIVTLNTVGTFLAGTLLARDSVSLKMVPYVKGGTVNDNGIPKAILLYDVEVTAPGDYGIRALVAGTVLGSRLIIDADRSNTNINRVVISQLQDYSGITVDVTDLSLLDEPTVIRTETNGLAANASSENILTPGWITKGANTVKDDIDTVTFAAGTNFIDVDLDAGFVVNDVMSFRVDLTDVSLTGDLKITFVDNFGLEVVAGTITVTLAGTVRTFAGLIDTSPTFGSTIDKLRIKPDTGVLGTFKITKVQAQKDNTPSGYVPNFVSKQLNGSFNEDDATGAPVIPATDPESNTTNSGWYWGQAKWVIAGGKITSQNIIAGSLHSKQKYIEGRLYDWYVTVGVQDLLGVTIAGDTTPGILAAGASYNGQVTGVYSSNGQLAVATSAFILGTELTHFYIVELDEQTGVDGAKNFVGENNNTIGAGNILNDVDIAA